MALGYNISFLGAGNMARALIRGLFEGAGASAEEIRATGRRTALIEAVAEEFGIQTSLDNAAAARWADVVVLCAKPQGFDRLLPDLARGVRAESLIVSVAAGVRTEVIESFLGGEARVVRAMPNTPALVDAGATALSAGKNATPDDVARARALFDAVGRTLVLEESQLDAVTGLSGSGPAYNFLILEALCDAGVKVGMRREDARLLAAQTMLGSARLVLETGQHPGLLKDMVTSPAGTAIAGLHTLEAGGVRTTLIDAVEVATRRARELGDDLSRRIMGGE